MMAGDALSEPPGSEPTDAARAHDHAANGLTFRQALILTRMPPGSTRSGDGIYSAQLMEAVKGLAHRSEVVCYGASDLATFEVNGFTVRTLMQGRWSLFRYIFGLDTKAGTAANTDANQHLLFDILVNKRPDIIVIDHIDQTWALPVIRKYRRRVDRTAILVYTTHNHEATSRLSIARQDSLPRSALYLIDALRASLRDKQMIAAAEVMTCICNKDGAAYRRAGHANVVVLEPIYQGRTCSSRAITRATPRRVVVVGSFLWSAKLISLQSFLEMAAARLVTAGIGVDVVGQMRPSDLARLRQAFPGINFTGEVEAVDPYLDGSRLALLIDQSGGGFKLTLLTYAFRRAPIAAVSSTLPDAEWGRYCIVADRLDALADAICSRIDDFTWLNEMHDGMFDFASDRVRRTQNSEDLKQVLRGMADSRC